jgi:hypothetical protein
MFNTKKATRDPMQRMLLRVHFIVPTTVQLARIRIGSTVLRSTDQRVQTTTSRKREAL